MTEMNKHRNTKLVSIIVINYNGCIYLKETIKPLLNLDYPRYEVIVVDNGSKDQSVEYIKSVNGVKYINSPVVASKNYACNIGIAHARGDYILLLDNDLLITDNNIISRLIENVSILTNCGCLSLAFLNRGDSLTNGYGCFVSYYYSWEKPLVDFNKLLTMHQMPVGSPNGAGIFIKKSVWEEMNGYDDYLTFGGDDDDLGMKLWIMGYNIYLFAESIQIHIGMQEREDTLKYSVKLQKKVYAHLYTIVKNFKLVNLGLTIFGYFIFSFAKAIKQSFSRLSFKPFSSTIIGYFHFIKNIGVAIKKRHNVQKNRVIPKDIFLKIRPRL